MSKAPIRILIVGMSGSGKSTLAKQISAVLDIKHVELDHLYFRDNWEEVSRDEFRENVREAVTSTPSWCLDGNYTNHMIDVTWPLATHIIYLRYKYWTTFYRLFIRSMQRCFDKQELFNRKGCVESFYKTFFDRTESILWFFFNSFHSTRAKLTKFIETREYISDAATTIVFTSPQETDLWLQRLKQTGSLSLSS